MLATPTRPISRLASRRRRPAPRAQRALFGLLWPRHHPATTTAASGSALVILCCRFSDFITFTHGRLFLVLLAGRAAAFRLCWPPPRRFRFDWGGGQPFPFPFVARGAPSRQRAPPRHALHPGIRVRVRHKERPRRRGCERARARRVRGRLAQRPRARWREVGRVSWRGRGPCPRSLWRSRLTWRAPPRPCVRSTLA